MLTKSVIDRIIPVLQAELQRALQLKAKGFPRPYFCSLLLSDEHGYNTWGSHGSLMRTTTKRRRNAFCDLRVGSYRYDQVTDGGLSDNDDDRESYSHSSLPTDDKDLYCLQVTLWRLAEAKYREALTDFSEKKAARVSSIDRNRKFASFARTTPQNSCSYKSAESVDIAHWERYCKKISDWTAGLEGTSDSWVEFDASQETRIFVSSESACVVQHRQIYSLSVTLRKLTKHGNYIEQELVFNRSSQSELPSPAELKRLVRIKHQQLLKLIDAKRIHAFSGPVLLYPNPAGLLFHEAIGHRLEGSRLRSTGEGQTFRGQIGKPVIGVPIDIWDDPNQKKFGGVRCIGAYDYDDEGIPAERTELVSGGILKGFLSTRAALNTGGFRSNGHARTRTFQRPISRMGVTGVQGREPVPMTELRQRLVEEIKAQGKPFGMIVYEVSGGETDTTSYDFQAFSGEISYASLIYPDGSEECIRGVDFVGTPLQALSNIIAVGDELELDNSYCGAESGFIPVSTISPAVLLSNLELQAKDEELVTQYILPKPMRG